MITQADLTVLDWIQENLRCGFLDAVTPFITGLAEYGMLWIILALCLMIYPKTRKAGAAVAIALVLELILCSGILKPLFARPRPYLYRSHGTSPSPPDTPQRLFQPRVLWRPCVSADGLLPWGFPSSSGSPGCICLCIIPRMCWRELCWGCCAAWPVHFWSVGAAQRWKNGKTARIPPLRSTGRKKRTKVDRRRAEIR